MLKKLFNTGVYVTAWEHFQILSLHSANRKGFARLWRYFSSSCVTGMRNQPNSATGVVQHTQ